MGSGFKPYSYFLSGIERLEDRKKFLKSIIIVFEGKRIDNPNTHGTGCTLSSAIASNLAKGYSLAESVGKAKEYVSGALEDMLDLGAGSGPMNHAFVLKK